MLGRERGAHPASKARNILKSFGSDHSGTSRDFLGDLIAR